VKIGRKEGEKGKGWEEWKGKEGRRVGKCASTIFFLI